MEEIANVDIDNGKFKYVLIKIIDGKNNKEKYIVRGYSWAAYHGLYGLLLFDIKFQILKIVFIKSLCIKNGFHKVFA